MCRASSYFICLLVTLASTVQVCNCILAEDEVEFSIEREGEIQKTPLPIRLLATFDLGELEPGAVGKLSLTVVNPSPYSLSFDEISTGCKCREATASAKTIEGNGGAIVLSVRLETPTTAKSPSIVQRLQLEGKTPEQYVEIELRYRLRGFLCFPESRWLAVAKSNASVVEFDLPLVMSVPVLMKNISLSHSDQLKTMRSRLVSEGDKTFVRCAMDVDDIQPPGLMGRVTVAESITKRSAEIIMSIRIQQPDDIAPEIAVFRYDEELKVHTSTVLVQLDIDQLSSKPSEFRPESVAIHCSGKSANVSVEKKYVAKGIFRVKIKFDTEKGGDQIPESGDLEWKISTVGKSVALVTEYRLTGGEDRK